MSNTQTDASLGSLSQTSQTSNNGYKLPTWAIILISSVIAVALTSAAFIGFHFISRRVMNNRAKKDANLLNNKMFY